MAKSRADEMTIVEHLVEFRKRLIAVVLCYIIVFLLAFVFGGELYQALTASLHQKLLVLGPNDILWIFRSHRKRKQNESNFKCGPQFVRPALKEKEARAVFAYIPASFICFVLGLAFGYFFVSPAILEVLMRLGEGLFDTQLTAQNYLTFLWHTTLPLGVLFELPVLVAFLTSIGLLTPQFLITYRRYAYFVLLVLAVVLTPADFISDLAMTLPLILLFEVSVTISKVIYSRKYFLRYV